MSSTTEATAALTEVSKDLLYQSESDEPFTPFTWKKAEGDLTPATVLKRARKPANSSVQGVSLQDFFKPLTTDQDWYGDEEKATAEGYRKLQKVIEQNLTDAKVFKVGKGKVGVFIVGKTGSGDWAGLKTTAVET
jgi:Nuclease A inhibitor-like protein